MEETVSATSPDTDGQIPTRETGLAEDIRRIDEKIAEIEAAVENLSREEVAILARRGESSGGDVDAIVTRTRQEQIRLQELRDAIEIEQAPLGELKSRRNELARRSETLKRTKIKELFRQILERIDSMQKELEAIKSATKTLSDSAP